MPELPEVEGCRRAIARWTAGRRIVGVDVFDPAVVRSKRSTSVRDALPGGAEQLAFLLAGARIVRLERVGKRIGIVLNRDFALLLHLGMTGHWYRRNAEDAPGPTVRLRWPLDDGQALWFADARRFGGVSFVPCEQLAAVLRDGLGPDAWDALPDAPALAARWRGKRPIKVILMDQAVLGGLGNIHAVEALWRAGIHPDRRGDALSLDDSERLRDSIHEQLAAAILEADVDGFTYVNEGGPNPFAVYGRKGLPCPRCGAAVESSTHAGRSTFWCSACQPA